MTHARAKGSLCSAISPGRLSGNRVISRLTDLRHEWEWRTIRSKDLRAKQKGAEKSRERKEAVTDQKVFERQQINIASGSSKIPPGGAGRLSQLPDAVADARSPALADAKASEKGALITSEVCFGGASGASADEKHIRGQDQSKTQIMFVPEHLEVKEWITVTKEVSLASALSEESF